MTLKRNHLFVLSTVLATASSWGFAPNAVHANPDTSSTDSASTTILASNPVTNAADRLQDQPIATLFSYPQAEQTATTLYVNRLPVLTFRNSGDADAETTAIAQQVSQDLNTLTAQANFDAANFAVRWEKDNQYTLFYGVHPLVTLNDKVFLSDRTGNAAQDALMAVNRFRRIIGGAAPLTDIPNQPTDNDNGAIAAPLSSGYDFTQVISVAQGNASWYGPGFDGQRTASGERFDQNDLTAAHKSLPFGTRVRVTNVNNGRSVVVRINDRGPYAHNRIIDLSKGSAQQIGLLSTGTGKVKLEVLAN